MAKTFSVPASALLKNAHVVMEGRPCKIIETSDSDDDATCHVVATDVFTGGQFENSYSSGERVDVPYVSRVEYQLVSPVSFCRTNLP